MARFEFFWRDGSHCLGEGETVEQAFTNAGFGLEALSTLDYYDTVDETPLPDIDHDVVALIAERDALALQLDIERQGAVEMAKVIAGLRAQIDLYTAHLDNADALSVESVMRYSERRIREADAASVAAESQAAQLRGMLAEVHDKWTAMQRLEDEEPGHSDLDNWRCWRKEMNGKKEVFDALVARLAPDAAKEVK